METNLKSDIRMNMQEIFHNYCNLRDKSSAERAAFWDAVVLTTFDEAQRICFVEQVQRKQRSGELPQVPILVVADPPGQKLGVGGSTLQVLSELSATFGQEICKKKVLVIHSGGSSKRLPSYSVLGKIFAPVPVEGLCVGNVVPQMLDLKLAMYLPFCSLLGPGVLVTCADDIETYCLDLKALDTEGLGRADVVALGHPSTLDIGTGHGVYVLQGGGEEVALSGNSSVEECLEVLQKPSISAMRASGAVFTRGDRTSKHQQEEEVWSDSIFWLSSRVCSRLLQWYQDNRPLGEELDAYAHILPCLGTRMKAAREEDFTDFRSQMLPLLRGASFKVIALPHSKFYHLGTMQEYSENFNTAQDFIFELGIIRNTSNMRGKCVECLVREGEEGLEEEEGVGNVHSSSDMQGRINVECMLKGGKEGTEKEEDGIDIFHPTSSKRVKLHSDYIMKERRKEKKEEGVGTEEDGTHILHPTSSKKEKTHTDFVIYKRKEKEQKHNTDTTQCNKTQGTIIESHLLPTSKIQLTHSKTKYVIEHCRIGVTLRLFGDTILSSCSLVSCPAVPLTPDAVIGLPSNIFFHTVPVIWNSHPLYITVAFDLDASMKTEASDLKDVKAFGKTLKDVADILELKEEEVKQERKVSLWNACIFPAAKTAAESFWLTHTAVCKVKGGCEGVSGGRQGLDSVLKGQGRSGIDFVWSEKRVFSMKNVVKMKDLNTMLEDRKKLVLNLAVGDEAVSL